MYSKLRHRPFLDPALDVWDLPHPGHQVLDLGALVQAGLVGEAGAEVVGVDVSPGEDIAGEVLTSPAAEAGLQVTQTIGDGLLDSLLHGGLVVAEHRLDHHLKQIVDSVHHLAGCTITEKAPTRAFSWLKAATTAFTFKTHLRHYAKQALTPRFLNVKLGPRRKDHKRRAGWLA